MKKLLLSTSLILVAACLITSCNKEDDKEEQTIDYAYHAHIHAPSDGVKILNDMLEIEVEFESHSGEAVHHINVRIYNATDNTEVYNQPGEAHIHEMTGAYEFKDELMLSTENGFSDNTDWIIEARVWGIEDGDGEEMERKEFSISL